jgi:hypothetical protein
VTAPRDTPVICPICLTPVDWSQTDVFTIDAMGEHVPFIPAPQETEARLADRRADAWRRCPGPGDEHYVPYRYAEFGPPIVVGVVGSTQVGKTLLLLAMLGQLKRENAMFAAGLEVSPLHLTIEATFQQQLLEPFLTNREQLPHTARGAAVNMTYGTTIYSHRQQRRYAVTFFDVSGEDLAVAGSTTSFIQAVNALIFVVDGSAVPGALDGGRVMAGDPTFAMVLRRLEERFPHSRDSSRSFLPIPAVVVVAKADMLQFDPTAGVRRWLDLQDDDVDLSTVEEESADVYSFLAARGCEPWLAPAHRCEDVSLHFASATNCSPVKGVFPRSTFRQRRVLKPLLSLLAMTGVGMPTPGDPGDRKGA